MSPLAAALIVLWFQPSDYQRGIELFRSGKREAAIQALRRASESSPKDARVWKALGVAYTAGEEYERAEPSFERACSLDPRLEDACYYLGRARYFTNNFEGALAAFRRALATERQSWRVETGIGECEEALGRAADAERTFLAAVRRCDGCDPRPGTAYALFLFRQGRIGDSLAAIRPVLERFPDSADAQLNAGRALMQLGRLNEAAPHLEAAVKLAPDSAQARLLLGKARARLDAQGSRTVK